MFFLWAEEGALLFKVHATFSLETTVSFPFPIPRLVAMYRKRHNALPVSRGASGLQSLQEACVFTKPEEEEGLDRQLWEGWEEGREELVRNDRSTFGWLASA